MALQPHFVTETTLLRNIARNPSRRIIYRKHALKSLYDDQRTTTDIEVMLTNCQVTLVERKKDVLWRAIGADLDGQKMEAVVAVYEEVLIIKVITTF